MDKYCCFFHPVIDYELKQITDLCPTCGLPYNHPLLHPPDQIGNYRVTGSLGRGFYGAAYLVEAGRLKTPYVLKISPTSFYDVFPKRPFETEAQEHADLAKKTTHVVDIIDYFQTDVVFHDESSSRLSCNVTVLEYVKGNVLNKYLTGAETASVGRLCQIAIDLLRIRDELVSNFKSHNDLHAENLIVEELQGTIRPNEIDGSIVVKVIDLGSVTEESKSSALRLGDLNFIIHHMTGALDRLLADPTAMDDRDYRVALALEDIIQQLKADILGLRIPNVEALTNRIVDAYHRAAYPWKPWRIPLNLKTFSDHYNAQTLDSWNVPVLRVDPQDHWKAAVAKPGPQIITGMRGCGKTMLLRSLDVHARIEQGREDNSDAVMARLKRDGYIGLFASSIKLLDLKVSALFPVEHWLARLFAAYSLEAVRALLHIRDVGSHYLIGRAHQRLGAAIEGYLDGVTGLNRCVSLEDLERQLLHIVVQVVSGDGKYSVRHAPAEVFTHLAEEFRACCEAFSGSAVYFLLDDVSTRYLDLNRLEYLLSGLLFQSPVCAFKFTSEWQTIELGLHSPGRVDVARIDRDFDVFDLGTEVLNTINAKGSRGKEFVSAILQRRAAAHSGHPSTTRDPKIILGDIPLEQIARELGAPPPRPHEKKHAYHGLSCLTNVCVGDIGDVIKLYEEILKCLQPSKQLPVGQGLQSECFQNMCSMRLYDLSRRGGYFKLHALGFAEASRELLVRSVRDAPTSGVSNRTIRRIRQFSSINVRVTGNSAEDNEKQISQLRQLIDAGVFVFSGGNARSKVPDGNPRQQFTLAFRKIYGITAGIGLADRDRFELSGDDLREWLAKPENAKSILLRNQLKGFGGNTYQAEEEQEDKNEIVIDDHGAGMSELSGHQLDLPIVSSVKNNHEYEQRLAEYSIREVNQNELRSLDITTVVAALGFEERTRYASDLLSSLSSPRTVNLIKYPLSGFGPEIEASWQRTGAQIRHIDPRASKVEHRMDGLSLIDISGLTKPLIFQMLRLGLLRNRRAIVCHVSAESYYPREEDLSDLILSKQIGDPLLFLEGLSHVLTGEKGPYKEVRLLSEQVDPSRKRALMAFGSAKHQRLFTLLDVRDFDEVNVFVPSGDAPRTKIARYAAEILCHSYANASMLTLDNSSIETIIGSLDKEYLRLYRDKGFNIEIGLTGSKKQAVAAAVLSTVRRVAQAWYVKPKKFDETRFSRGVGRVRLYDIQIPDV